MSSIYTIQCRNHKQDYEFTYSVGEDKYLNRELGGIYVYCRMDDGKDISINYVKCPVCHTSSSANLVIIDAERRIE